MYSIMRAGIISLVQGLFHKYVYSHCQSLTPLNDSEVDEALRLSAQHEDAERYRVAVAATRDIFIRADLEVMRIVAEQVLKDSETLRRQSAKRQLVSAI